MTSKAPKTKLPPLAALVRAGSGFDDAKMRVVPKKSPPIQVPPELRGAPRENEDRLARLARLSAARPLVEKRSSASKDGRSTKAATSKRRGKK